MWNSFRVEFASWFPGIVPLLSSYDSPRRGLTPAATEPAISPTREPPIQPARPPFSPARPPAKQSARPPADWPAIHFCRHRLPSRIALSGRRRTGHTQSNSRPWPSSRQTTQPQGGSGGGLILGQEPLVPPGALVVRPSCVPALLLRSGAAKRQRCLPCDAFPLCQSDGCQGGSAMRHAPDGGAAAMPSCYVNLKDFKAVLPRRCGSATTRRFCCFPRTRSACSFSSSTSNLPFR